MKKRLKKISLAGFLISAALWIAVSLCLTFNGVELFGYYIGEIFAIVFGGVPMAFLQLRLCLTEREKWVRWVPAAVSAAVWILSLILYFTDDFGGMLLALILAVFGLAPTAGICLGWLAHGKKPALIPLNVMLIIYLVMNGIPIVSRPIEPADIAVFLYAAAGVYLFIRPAERGGENEPEN